MRFFFVVAFLLHFQSVYTANAKSLLILMGWGIHKKAY